MARWWMAAVTTPASARAARAPASRLEDAVHPAEVEDHPAVTGHRAGRVAAPRPAGDHRQAVMGADLDHAADLLGGRGEDDGIGEPALARGAEGVVRVGGEVRRSGVEVRRPDLPFQVAPGRRGEHPRRF